MASIMLTAQYTGEQLLIEALALDPKSFYDKHELKMQREGPLVRLPAALFPCHDGRTVKTTKMNNQCFELTFLKYSICVCYC